MVFTIKDIMTRLIVNNPNSWVVLRSNKSPPKKADIIPSLLSGFSIIFNTITSKHKKLKFVYMERKLFWKRDIKSQNIISMMILVSFFIIFNN